MSYDDIREQLSALRLKGMLQAFDEIVAEPSLAGQPWQKLFPILLDAEVTYRQTRSFMYRLDLAKLPQIKTFENFDVSNIPTKKEQVDKLCQCSFIDAHENVLIIGGSGTGKSHIALALAYKALQLNHRIRFYRFNELASSLLAAKEHRYEANRIAHLLRYSLLVVDELGYLPIDQTAGPLLFELFSQFYERGSLIITTHLAFDEWGELFGSKKATTAMIDRLTHHCHLVETGNESWRLKEVNDNKK